MIDKHIDIEAFSHHTKYFHQSGLDKHGKAYKRHSHAALVSAFFNIIEQLEVITCLEIGAFQAETSVKFISGAPARHALAVEASPYNFHKYKDTLTDAGILYHHAAVLDREGPCELQLHVTDIDIKNGYIRGNNSLLKCDARPGTRAVTVPGTTLDALVNSYVAKGTLPNPEVAPPVLWIDAEGALSRVITGGAQTIKNSSVIFAEVETECLWNDQATFKEVAIQLNKLGFFPWLRDCEYEPEQFNVIFANHNLVDTTLLEKLAEQFYSELQNIM